MGGTLRDLIRGRLGCETTPEYNRDVATVGVAVVRVARQSPNRVLLRITNCHATQLIYTGPFPDVSATKHLARLAPAGGGLTLVWDEDFDLCGREWYAVADGAATDILVSELLTVAGAPAPGS